MSKSLRHYKRRNNKTQRKRRGGMMMFDKDNVNEVGSLLDNPHVLVLHSSKTCDHCKKFEPVWKRLARRARRLNSELAFAEFDPEASPFAAKQLHPEVNVSGVPTLVYINKIKNKRVEYAGERTEQAIMEWLMKHSDKRIKITIETEDKDAPASPAPAAESFTDIPESFPAPVSLAPVSDTLSQPVSDSFPESVSSDTLSQPVSDLFPESVSSDTLSQPVSDALSSDSVSAAAAFPPPPAEAAPTSVVGTIKDAASSVNNAIGSTVEKAKNALTQDIDLSGLFASTPAAATAAPAAAPAAPAAAPTAAPAPTAPDAASQAPIQPVPQVPSLGGKKRKITRRKHRRASSKKTKKSKSKSKSKK
jgi:hypothetical protein